MRRPRQHAVISYLADQHRLGRPGVPAAEVQQVTRVSWPALDRLIDTYRVLGNRAGLCLPAYAVPVSTRGNVVPFRSQRLAA